MSRLLSLFIKLLLCRQVMGPVLCYILYIAKAAIFFVSLDRIGSCTQKATRHSLERIFDKNIEDKSH